MKSFVAVLFCLVLFTPVVFVGCDREQVEPSNLVNAPLEAPHAAFSYTGDLTTPTSILFHNSSVNADRYNWSFGDGRTATDENPVIGFGTYGDYTVILIATQSSTGRSDTSQQTISIASGILHIDSLWVLAMPFTNRNGVAWDTTSGPDLYFDIHIINVIFAVGAVSTNVSPVALPVRWSFQSGDWNFMSLPSNPLEVRLWDQDEVANELIGSVFFTPEEFVEMGRPRTVTLSDTAQTIRVQLSLHWQ